MFEGGDFRIELVRNSDDPQVNSPEFQKEISQFGASLRSANIRYGQSAMAFDSVDAHGFPLPEFILAIKTLASSPAVTVLGGALATWLGARYGRKVRLKIADIEAEARTPKEIDELLAKAAKFQQENGDSHGDKREP